MFVLVLVCLSSPLAAQERVSLSALLDEALAAHPALTAAGARRDAATERVAQDHALPDPMVSAGYASVGNPLPGAGLRREPLANLSVMVSQTFPYPGTRALRASAARRDADAAAPLVDMARLEIVLRVKQAYYRLAGVHATSEVLARNVQLLDTLLQVSEGRYAVGQAAQQDVIKAQTELSILELQQRRLNQERLALETELNVLRGKPPLAAVGRPDDLAFIPFDQQLEPLLAGAREHAPMLERDRLMVASAETAISLARQAAKPDITVSGGYAYSGAMPRMFEARVDVNLPLRQERRLAAVAEQQLRLRAAQADLAASERSLDADLQAEFRAAATASELARLYRDTVLPQARLALESSITSYESGAVDFLSVLTNFSSVLQYETSYVEELMNVHVASSRVESMTGTPLAH